MPLIAALCSCSHAVPERPRSPSLSLSLSLSPSRSLSLSLSLSPTGTGKTTTLVAYLLALCAARGTGRVLVCAPSNRGVQEVCERFLGAQQTVAAEDEAILIGDADKVPSDAPCRRVFVFALAERWGMELEAAAQAVPERLVSTALCSEVDCQSLVRVRHCEACAAQTEHVRSALGSTSAVIGAIGASIRRRHPHSWRSHGLQRVLEVAGSTTTAAAAALDEVSAAWPCQLRCRSDELHERLHAVRKSVLESANLVSETLRDADAHAEALASARIVFATLCVAGSYLVRCMPPVSHLVVDEAAQATEPEALIPLLCQPRRMLLTGDPCQLCCMCVSARARAAGLERSLMARLLDARAVPLHFLSTQYRMHPSIAAFPSRQFYQGKLIDAPCTASLANTAAWVRSTGTPNGAPHFGPCTPRHSHLGPWSLIDVADGAERQRADGSIYNADEAAVVVALVRELHNEWNLEVRAIRALRVLTFYAAQVGEISRALAAAGLRGVVVGTVDGSQGSEADVILLSCVRSNAGARLGFVTDWRRLNVAITRAKQACIIVAHAATLGRGPPGDAAADLVRAASAAGVIYTPTGQQTEVRLAANVPWRHTPARAGLAHGDGAPVEPPAQAAAAALATPRAAMMLPKRALERAERHAVLDLDDDAHDDAFLQARAAEVEAYVSSCRRADAERAEKRRRERQMTLEAAAVVFGPPTLY